MKWDALKIYCWHNSELKLVNSKILKLTLFWAETVEIWLKFKLVSFPAFSIKVVITKRSWIYQYKNPKLGPNSKWDWPFYLYFISLSANCIQRYTFSSTTAWQIAPQALVSSNHPMWVERSLNQSSWVQTLLVRPYWLHFSLQNCHYVFNKIYLILNT